MQLGISNSEDGIWSAQGYPVIGDPVEIPEEYAAGLLVSDPLSEYLAASSDPATLVGNLTTIGYPAAVVPIDPGPDCTVDAMLEGVAGRFSWLIAAGDIGILTIGEDLDCEAIGGTPRGDPPVLPPKPGTAPAWSPPNTDPTIPVTPAWLPGPWPTQPGTPPTPNYYCVLTQIFGGGSECKCTRIRVWGRWETEPNCTFFCIQPHYIEEKETCRATGPACAPNGPPAAGAQCDVDYN